MPSASTVSATGCDTLGESLIALLPQSTQATRVRPDIPPLQSEGAEIAISAVGLTRRFGGFVAADDVSFTIERGRHAVRPAGGPLHDDRRIAVVGVDQEVCTQGLGMRELTAARVDALLGHGCAAFLVVDQNGLAV